MNTKESQEEVRKIYLASGWFNENQEHDLQTLYETLDDLKFNYGLKFEVYKPREVGEADSHCHPAAREKIFRRDIEEIDASNLVIVNTRDKDLGSIFEAGYAYAKNKKILYYSEGLAGNFNIMLAQSGWAVCCDKRNVIAVILDIFLNNSKNTESYSGTVE